MTELLDSSGLDRRHTDTPKDIVDYALSMTAEQVAKIRNEYNNGGFASLPVAEAQWIDGLIRHLDQQNV
jgi:hypothetical protein